MPDAPESAAPPARPLVLARLAWPEVERYLERSSGVVVPIGSTEQHGPIGLVGTDALCAEAVAHGVSARAGALLAPTLPLGPAQFNLGFAGTISLRPGTLVSLLVDCIESLARHGLRHIYFVNGHGGNVAPLKSAFQEVYQRRVAHPSSRVRCRARAWWEHPRTDALRRELYGAGEGMHATPSEIAITQHVLPHTARDDPASPVVPLEPGYLRDHAGDDHYDAHHHRARFPDGRVGSDSALARPEHGARLLACAVDEACADYQNLLEEN